MALHKMVDGVKVDLTPQEEKEILEYWKMNGEIEKKTAHIEQRRSEYPSLFEIAEALVDALDCLSNAGIKLGGSSQGILTKVKAIQEKYPQTT